MAIIWTRDELDEWFGDDLEERNEAIRTWRDDNGTDEESE